MRRKIRNSLSIKVFLWVFAALSICSTIIYGIVLTVLPRQYQFTADRRLDNNTEILVSKLQNISYKDASREIYNFCIQNNVSAILSDGKETLHFGEVKSPTASSGVFDPRGSRQMRASSRLARCFAGIDAEEAAATSNIAATVSFLDNEAEYTLVISSISQTADIILSLMFRFLPIVFVIIMILSFLSAFICSKVIVTPIAKISQISKRMTSLDLTWKCDIKSNDEMGVLAASLNTMAGRLQEAMEELENANHQLTDDVEKFKAIEEQRRNFFAAVSHELKTPLTILKGQIENMILGYGDYQNHEKYLPEALQTTEDIEHLVREIITISKMESMDLQNPLQEVSLQASVRKTVQTILPIARDKDIQIHQNINMDVVLSVNPNLWHKALSNIIGNAVRHSPSGEDIFISLQNKEKGNALVIENTGAAIPENDLPHIFTPFYRADKSRSKATGGSGLGLYIVKTILDLHGMAYCIKNTEQGVAFFLSLNG